MSDAGATWRIRRPLAGLPRPDRTPLLGLPRPELGAWLKSTVSAPSYRADQVFRWLHRERVDGFDAMTDVPATERARLAELATTTCLAVDTIARARDGTAKLRLRTADGHAIESVLIPNDERGHTLCISSQAGCALDCRFCATASLGFRRNLAAAEIVEQVRRARDLLAGDANEGRVTNLVYMGMGEPLHNYANVRASI
jgi:23S rRNA (adenine2503-C2)-methyltransferase